MPEETVEAVLAEPVAGPPRRVAMLEPGVERVVGRWNPHGLALLLAMGSGRGGDEVVLVGRDAGDTALLRAELARCVPRVEVVDGGARGWGTGEFDSEPRESVVRGAGGVEGRPVAVACVVLEAGAPVGRETLGTVRALRAAGTRIVFALEGFAAHAEWRAVLEGDARVLAAGAAVEIVPVSARLAALARANGDAALADRSGLGLLHARLVAAAGAGAAEDQVALVRARVLEQTRERIGCELAKLRDGGDVAALRAERAALLAIGDGGRGPAMSMLRNRLHLARVDLVHEVGVRVRGVHTAARAEIDRLPRARQPGYPGVLQAAVEKITREIDRAVRMRLAELADLVERSVGIAGATPAAAAPDTPGVERDVRRPRVGPGPDPRCRGVEDHLMIALGASAGFGLGRLMMAPLALWEALEYGIVPVGLFLGAAVAAWVVRARRELADRAHLGQWAADVLVNVKAQLEQRVATALVEAEERLTEHVVTSSTAQLIETDRRVGELEARLRQAAQRRPALSTACERDLTALEFA
ncbi:hypothetical protein ACWIGI_04905 [Nocardia sp. NPDC055321]